MSPPNLLSFQQHLHRTIGVPVADSPGKQFRNAALKNDVAGLKRIFKDNPKLDRHESSSNGNTALHWAASSNAKDAVQFLLGIGCRIDIPNKEGKTPLVMTSSTAVQRLFQDILMKGTIDSPHAGVGTQKQNLYQTTVLRFPQLTSFLHSLTTPPKSILLLGPGVVDPTIFTSFSNVSAQLLELMLLLPDSHITIVDREPLAEILSFSESKIRHFVECMENTAESMARKGYPEILKLMPQLKRNIPVIIDPAHRDRHIKYACSSIETHVFGETYDAVISTFSLMYAAEALRSDGRERDVDRLHKDLFRSLNPGGRVCVDISSTHWLLPPGPSKSSDKSRAVFSALATEGIELLSIRTLDPPKCMSQDETGWTTMVPVSAGRHACTTGPMLVFTRAPQTSTDG